MTKSRRQFLKTSALGAAATAVFGSLIAGVRSFLPLSSQRQHIVKIGRPADLPLNTFILLEEARIYVHRGYRGVRALSAVCTHLGCLVEKAEDGFQCPCHGSLFSDQGRVISGPAPKSLVWYLVFQTVDGELAADTQNRVSAEDIFLIA